MISQHPNLEQLRQFALGLSQADTVELLESHVLECSICWTTLRELPQADPFLDGLRALQRPAAGSPAVEVVVPGDPGRESWHAFLEPPAQPQHLGRLDHYEVAKVIGRGGMGIVFQAYDTKLQRPVAIKMLAPELASDPGARHRFEREARAAAAIRDPHVIDIHAVSTEGAIPYLVMEHIAGCSLQERIKDGPPLEILEILQIGLQVAQGLAAAHAQGLVHRDVKPANILLARRRSSLASWEDEAPKQDCFVYDVKLTDFGLARAGEDTHLTRTGLLAGTPLYMSPEQAEGRSVDQRSDLFSLGSMLYQLCTGLAPFQANTPVAVLRRVCDHTPLPIRDINPDIPEKLSALIHRLLAKDPMQRFQRTAEVAELLSQQLAEVQRPRARNEPTAAAPAPVAAASAATRGWKRRMVGAVVLVLVLGVGITAVFYRPPHGKDVKPHASTSGEAPAVPTGTAGQTNGKSAQDKAAFRHREAAVHSVAWSPDGKLLASAANTVKPHHGYTGWEVKLWEAATGHWIRDFTGHADGVPAVAFSPDGQRLASACHDGTLKVWEVETGEELFTRNGPGTLSSVAFSPNGMSIATANFDGTIILWGADGRRKLTLKNPTLGFAHRGAVLHVCFSPDSSRLASSGADKCVRIWDAADGQQLDHLSCERNPPFIIVRGAAFSPDGLRLVTSRDVTCPVWDVATGEVLFELDHGAPTTAVDWTRDGGFIATASQDGVVKVWHADTGIELQSREGQVGGIWDIAFRPDGQVLALGCTDSVVRLWGPAAAWEKVKPGRLP